MLLTGKMQKKLIGSCFGLLCLLMPGIAGANTLQDVTFSALSGGRLQITLVTSEPVESPSSFTTDNPARIAVDLPNTSSALDSKMKNIGSGVARSVMAIEAKDRTRVVVNLVDAVPYELKSDGNRLHIMISGSSGGSSMPVTEKMSVAKTAESKRAAASSNSVANIDFRRGAEGEGRVEIVLSDPGMIVDMRQQGEKILLDFPNASLPGELARTLDVTDFATPVLEVASHAMGNSVQVAIKATGHYEHLAYQTGNDYVVEFRPLTAREKEARKKELMAYTGERLSLNFQDIEVRSVLQLLADFTGLNMVVSDTVKGRITLRLKNVPWDQAMDIILKTKGLSMRKTDNVILVAPTEEIAAREKLELESQQQIEDLSPLRSELMQINYAKAADFAALLKSEENRLLSSRGSVTIDDRTNTLLIQDTSVKLEEIRKLISELDKPVRQVLIDSRIVTANDDYARDLGVKLGLSALGEDRWKGNNVAIGGGLEGDIAYNPDFGQSTIVTKDNENLMVNLPQTLSATRGGAINFLIGKIGSHLLRLELNAMQQEGKGEVVSSPRVITADQQKAVIKQGDEVPYQEASSSGATSVSFKEAVLELEVTPHITPDDRVIMDLKVSKDYADFTRSVLGVPPIKTQSVETNVLVDNGETVVLGGVLEREKSDNMEKVPFFGDLPYVGFMFKQHQVKDENSELLIFVTPKILKETLTLQ